MNTERPMTGSDAVRIVLLGLLGLLGWSSLRRAQERHDERG